MKKGLVYRTTFNSAPWVKGGWIRCTQDQLRELYRTIGSPALVRRVLGWTRQVKTAKTLSYFEFRAICELAGKPIADVKYSGSNYWLRIISEEIDGKVRSRPANIQSMEVSLDLTGMDLEQITCSLPELDVEQEKQDEI